MNVISENYDSPRVMEDYITTLEKLTMLADTRRKIYQTNHELMNEFYLFDRLIMLDRCGNTMVQIRPYTYSCAQFPTNESICPCCGKGWNLSNISDYIISSKPDGSFSFHHKRCYQIQKMNKLIDAFTTMMDVLYKDAYSFRLIPNEYCDCESCAPWFLFSTPDGEIKLGWRKRVINISWLPSYKTFKETFESENVTKWNDENSRGIHAWSEDKCLEYLFMAKNSIIK